MSKAETSRPPIVCPACSGENPGDAVFCGNPVCHKALGDFRYVLEEIRTAGNVVERISDKITEFVGHPRFIAIHAAWFALWAALNSGLIAASLVFDEYPYSLLGIVLSMEAVFITSFLLISSNRQLRYSDKRAELDYEVNVKSYRRIQELAGVLEQLQERIVRLEKR